MVFQQGSNGFRTKLTVSVIFVVILAICLIFSFRRKVDNEIPVINIRASELFDSFALDPASAYYNYQDKVIVVEGQVNSITGKTISLGSGVRIVRLNFNNSRFRKLPPIKKGETLVVKGVCLGLDYADVIVGNSVLIAHIPSL